MFTVPEREQMKRIYPWIVTMLTLLLPGCFKAHNGVIGGGPSITIELRTSTPHSGNTLNPGEMATVTALVYDSDGQGVTWTVSPVNFGTLGSQTSSSVDYTAPNGVAAATSVTVTAASITNPNVTASTKLTVAPAIIVPYVANSLLQAVYSSQAINQGDQLPIYAGSPYNNSPNVTWTLSSGGVGSLVGATSNPVTYVAPSSVTSPTTVVVTATSQSAGGFPVTGTMEVTVFPSGAGSNVAAVHVNGGPVPGKNYPNAPFTSVTICNPGNAAAVGSSVCQTVDGILVDTGSSGLRILQSQIPLLSLHGFSDSNGNSLQNCHSQPNGSYLWGPVVSADVYIAGEIAVAQPIQLISSSNAVVPDGCANGGVLANTPELLGANGILGVGPEPTDCMIAGINYCDGSHQPVPPNLYYACPSVGCSTAASSLIVNSTQQVANPIPLFATMSSPDNNGMILQLPAVSGTMASVTGAMIFGIGSEPNNALGGATIFTLDSNDHFTTLYNGQTLTSSFIVSSSSGLLFPDSLPTCSLNTQYFCPGSLTNLSATINGATQGLGVVNFSVDNADSLLSTNPSDAAFSALAGPMGTADTCSGGTGSCAFEWGLPFFYGRSVYVAIDALSNGKRITVAGVQVPWWAF